MRTLALRRIFFLGVMGWGDGDIQVSRRRRRRSSEAPGSSPRLPEAPRERQNQDPSRPIWSPERQNQAFMHVFRQISDEFVPLPSEIDFATGHFPEFDPKIGFSKI